MNKKLTLFDLETFSENGVARQIAPDKIRWWVRLEYKGQHGDFESDLYGYKGGHDDGSFSAVTTGKTPKLYKTYAGAAAIAKKIKTDGFVISAQVWEGVIK